MQLSRTIPPVVQSSVVHQFDPRLMNGIYQTCRLPQSFYSPELDPPTPPVEKESVAEQVKKALSEILGAKNGDPMAALDTLIRKNHKLEVRAEDAEKALKNLKATVPDEKTLLELGKWRELGESPDKVKTALDSGTAATQEAAKFKRSAALTASGIDPEKFNALAGADKWTFGERNETKDGKTVKVAVATILGADGKEVTKPVAELVGEQFPQFADALKITQGAATTKTVTPFGTGPGIGSGATSSTVWDRIREEKKRPEGGEGKPKPWTEQLGLPSQI